MSNIAPTHPHPPTWARGSLKDTGSNDSDGFAYDDEDCNEELSIMLHNKWAITKEKDSFDMQCRSIYIFKLKPPEFFADEGNFDLQKLLEPNQLLYYNFLR